MSIPASVVAHAKALGLPLDRCTVDGKTLAEVETQKTVRPKYRSKTEELYALLLSQEKQSGTIREWWYEPCKFRLSDPDPQTKRARTYCPDFLIWWPVGVLEFVEVKGGFAREDSLKTFDWARNTFSMFRWRMVSRDNGVWTTIRGEDTIPRTERI